MPKSGVTAQDNPPQDRYRRGPLPALQRMPHQLMPQCPGRLRSGRGRKTETGPGFGREYDARREYETGTGATNMRGRNTAALVLAGLMTTTLIACSATSTRPSTGQMLDDSVVTAKVKAALIQDPVTKAHQINVETFKGEVQLSGFVDDNEARTRALQVARDIEGVKNVTDAMEVRSPGS